MQRSIILPVVNIRTFTEGIREQGVERKMYRPKMDDIIGGWGFVTCIPRHIFLE
jgi:hypothetical protein